MNEWILALVHRGAVVCCVSFFFELWSVVVFSKSEERKSCYEQELLFPKKEVPENLVLSVEYNDSRNLFRVSNMTSCFDYGWQEIVFLLAGDGYPLRLLHRQKTLSSFLLYSFSSFVPFFVKTTLSLVRW